MRLCKAFLEIPLRKVDLIPGSTGASVFSLQKRLLDLGYSPVLTGIYDQATLNAVRAFQASRNLPANGITDWKTYLYIWREAGSEIIPREKPTTALAAANASIHIARGARTLSLYIGNTLRGQYPIAVGKPNTPTPLGNYAIATKITNPGGVLGTRWMGLNLESYGIHGTNRPWLIGQAVSLGCIRMHNNNVENVFSSVRLGTPVYIRE